MSQQTDAQLKVLANIIGDETTEGANTSDRIRQMLINIIDSKGNNTSVMTVVTWNFPGGAFPTNPKPLYISITTHGNPGDADFIDINTWFIANTPTPSVYADFNYK